MLDDMYIRTAAVLTEEGVLALQTKTVAVFGVGGVGAACVEALARAGVGHLILIDGDRVVKSNINRQLIALHSTLGQNKTDAAAARLRDINPNIRLTLYPLFYDETTKDLVDLSNCDHIIDCIDSVPSKILLYQHAQSCKIPVLACMGTGRKTDPTQFIFTDIKKTKICPLARTIRLKCRQAGIDRLQVLYSTQSPQGQCLKDGQKQSPGSLSFVPPVAGMMLAGKVILTLSGYSSSAASSSS